MTFSDITCRLLAYGAEFTRGSVFLKKVVCHKSTSWNLSVHRKRRCTEHNYRVTRVRPLVIIISEVTIHRKDKYIRYCLPLCCRYFRLGPIQNFLEFGDTMPHP